MKVIKTLMATVFECKDCNQEFKSTDEDRKLCAMCDGRNIIKKGPSTIIAPVEVEDPEDEQ